MFGRLAAAALRGGGRLVVAHVVPDSITPWEIRRNTSRAASKVLSSKKKKKKKPEPSRTTRQPGRYSNNDSQPSGTTRQRFDKNSWSQGRGLQSRDKWHDDPPARATSGSSSRPRSQSMQRLRDLAKHPGLVVQMKADELLHAVRQTSRGYADNAREYGQQARRNLRSTFGSRR